MAICDITNAFTQSDIDSEIYVEPPRGFEKYDEHGKSYVLKLKRALYGTKQASRMWQLKLRSHLISKMGFTNSSHDSCLFSRHWDDGTVILVGVYVDDIILAHNGKLSWFINEFTGPKGFRAKHRVAHGCFKVYVYSPYTLKLRYTVYVYLRF